ncbi:glycine/sarcosine/betaine reductase selenoprotein B family protein [Bacillus sp. M6-12]|uniref:glycine/sarcosine/betaine reductase selenoprotein B family protein n=1 Tax=Bacillus sp. M6-12 TaxID=2054166 RepID=UPI0015E121D4|nr:glycine/sarcosine/betaine reductase selenoprotein B family protein [Bacillus sp. M6-12]
MIEKVEKAVQERWVPSFRFERNEAAPFTPFKKKTTEAKIALITTGGVYIKGMTPFNDNYGLGDVSYREIPVDTNLSTVSFAHEHYDQTNARKDPNVVFPLDVLKELLSEGKIGELAETHYSFMGYIPVPHSLKNVTAPEVAKKLKKAKVDAVILVPS